MKNRYLAAFAKLSGRARNILSDLELDTFENFRSTIRDKNQAVLFASIRN